MLKYILKRLATSVAMLFMLSFLVFILMTLMPGDPLDILVASNPNMTGEDLIRLKALYGIDQSGYIRYFKWLTQALQGDLGFSRVYKVPVMQIATPAIVNTFFLASFSLLFSVAIALFLGTWAALHPKSKADYAIGLFTFSGVSLPSFWIGILLILIFSVNFAILPAGGTITVGLEHDGIFPYLFDRLKHLALPVASLSLAQAGVFTRYIRSAFLEILHEDYIRTAYAKGAAPFKVVFKHAFKNTLIPLITVVAIQFGYLFSGAVITETVFSYNGLGRLIYSSIIGNDFNVAMVGLMIIVAMVLLMSMLADILYTLADPRVSYD